jgi:hypothetical protein
MAVPAKPALADSDKAAATATLVSMRTSWSIGRRLLWREPGPRI